MRVIRTQQEIDEIQETCLESMDKGSSKYPGMTYEEGIDCVLRWLFGESDEHPFE